MWEPTQNDSVCDYSGVSSYNKLIVLRLQVSVRNLILELSTRCVRITRVVEVSERCPSAQCPVFAVVLILCRALARYVNKKWTKEQLSQPITSLLLFWCSDMVINVSVQ